MWSIATRMSSIAHTCQAMIAPYRGRGRPAISGDPLLSGWVLRVGEAKMELIVRPGFIFRSLQVPYLYNLGTDLRPDDGQPPPSRTLAVHQIHQTTEPKLHVYGLLPKIALIIATAIRRLITIRPCWDFARFLILREPLQTRQDTELCLTQ